MKKWKWEDYLIGGLASIWLVWVFGRFIQYGYVIVTQYLPMGFL